MKFLIVDNGQTGDVIKKFLTRRNLMDKICVVIPRTHNNLVELIKEALEERPNVEVVLDRRHRDRRVLSLQGQLDSVGPEERRHGERRRASGQVIEVAIKGLRLIKGGVEA